MQRYLRISQSLRKFIFTKSFFLINFLKSEEKVEVEKRPLRIYHISIDSLTKIHCKRYDFRGGFR